MFKAIGILVLLYTFYGASKGEIYARSGAWGKTVTKAESPKYFWTIVIIYVGLGIALITIF